MFLHTENQQLLWQTLQKSPYLVDFTQKFSGYREEWFRGILEQFYTQWISQNNPLPSNARELLEINKHALQFMVVDLKRLLGYSSSSQTFKKNAEYDVTTYNVAEERKRKEDAFSANFNQYQSEYNRLLERPVLPVKELPVESADTKIKNMDELLKEQARLREMDLNIYPAQQNTLQSPKLKIMDEIERIEMQIEDNPKKTVQFSDTNVEFLPDEISSISQ